MKQVKFKKLHPDAVLPKRAHSTDACFDVVATSKREDEYGRVFYGLGFSVEIPAGTRFDLRCRSSIFKTGLSLAYGIGTGDEGYTGEYTLVFYNLIKELPNYEVGDRVAQVCLDTRLDVEFVEVEALSETERGEGGLGSTGK